MRGPSLDVRFKRVDSLSPLPRNLRRRSDHWSRENVSMRREVPYLLLANTIMSTDTRMQHNGVTSMWLKMVLPKLSCRPLNHPDSQCTVCTT